MTSTVWQPGLALPNPGPAVVALDSLIQAWACQLLRRSCFGPMLEASRFSLLWPHHSPSILWAVPCPCGFGGRAGASSCLQGEMGPSPLLRIHSLHPLRSLTQGHARSNLDFLPYQFSTGLLWSGGHRCGLTWFLVNLGSFYFKYFFIDNFIHNVIWSYYCLLPSYSFPLHLTPFILPCFPSAFMVVWCVCVLTNCLH